MRPVTDDHAGGIRFERHRVELVQVEGVAGTTSAADALDQCGDCAVLHRRQFIECVEVRGAVYPPRGGGIR